MGFLCTLAAGLGVEEGFLEPVLESETLFPYQSVVVVREEAPYTSLRDLKGLPFAFTDPLSNTGHAWPRILASGLGEDFFQRAFFTYGHDRALRAVLQGLAEGAAVDRVVYEALGLGGLRVLAQGPEDPAPPVPFVVGAEREEAVIPDEPEAADVGVRCRPDRKVSDSSARAADPPRAALSRRWSGRSRCRAE